MGDMAEQDTGRGIWDEGAYDSFPARLQQFQDEGLLWLVNSAVLHPRGYALCIFKEEGKPVALGLLGDGTEPWVFAEGYEGVPDGSVYDRFERAEVARYERSDPDAA